MTPAPDDPIGVFVCLTRSCSRRNVEQSFPWNGDWPLGKRQHKCGLCRKRMLLIKVKKVMTAEAKAKLAAFTARKKADKEALREGS